MATNEYITLTTSGSTLSKKYYAILNGYFEMHRKTQTIDKNIEGNPLITNGGITREWDYVLKVTESVQDSSFGTKANITTMFDLNNPNGSPTDVLTLIDHYGISHSVKFFETLSINPLTTILEGEDSYFYTPIKLIEVIDE